MRTDFLRFSAAAIYPTKGSSDVASFDLYSVEDVLVPLSTVKIIRTDIGFKTPDAILERFIHVLALHLDLQMSVAESFIPTTEVRCLWVFLIFLLDLLR